MEMELSPNMNVFGQSIAFSGMYVMLKFEF